MHRRRRRRREIKVEIFKRFVASVILPRAENLRGDEVEIIIKFRYALGIDDLDGASAHIEIERRCFRQRQETGDREGDVEQHRNLCLKKRQSSFCLVSIFSRLLMLRLTSPSTLFGIACVMDNVPYINGSPQNTFVPGLIELAIQRNCLIGGDDFKSGHTKMKSVLVDFLVGAGIKPTSIISYNHLGNNDGMNLSAPQTFRSKEMPKSNVDDDMVSSNRILYEPGEHPDHVIVIKYVPYVGDSKRAMDEYTSEIFMGSCSTIVLHNTCEDSLLAAPIILDLVMLAELSPRIQVKAEGEGTFHSFHPVATILSYLTKAPLQANARPVNLRRRSRGRGLTTSALGGQIAPRLEKINLAVWNRKKGYILRSLLRIDLIRMLQLVNTGHFFHLWYSTIIQSVQVFYLSSAFGTFMATHKTLEAIKGW